MTLSLSAAELERVQRAQRTLLRPLDYSTLDAWRHEVNKTVRELLGADLATFAMPVQDELPLYNPDVDLDHLLTYPRSLRQWDEKAGSKMARLRVWTRRSLFRDGLDEYYQSKHYNEWIVPTRAFDALGATVALGSTKQYATLFFHHDRPTGRKFGRRGADVLRLLYPAFDAGLHAYLEFHERRKTLLGGIDELDEGVLLFDRSVAVVHQNAAATNLFQQDAQREKLFAAARGLADALLNGRKHADSPVPRAVIPATTSRHSYRLRACLLEASLFGEDTPVMVFLRKERRRLPTEAELQARYRLTERETSVALLLADRYSNDEIAATLGISPHTAHHHTERVLGKLGVTSRNRVRKRLQRARG